MKLGSCAHGKHWSINGANDNDLVVWVAPGVPKPMFIKVDEEGQGSLPEDCARGLAYLNNQDVPTDHRTYQGFSLAAATGGPGQLQLASSACPGMCLGYPAGTRPAVGASPNVRNCSLTAPWERK